MPRRQLNPGQDGSDTAMVLILGTADWDQAIATNQHYMARELAVEFPVVFSESLGLRRPELNRRDIGRMFRRLLRGSQNAQRSRPIPQGISVVRPIIIPFHNRVTRQINRMVLRLMYASWVRHDGPRILWTYSPVTYGFEALADVTIYHCVDLLGEFPQISQDLISDGEASLAQKADLAVASSLAVQKHLDRAGFPLVVHWPNVADVSTIASAKADEVERVPGRVVFAGNFSDKKVDFAILRQLLDSGVELHLAGPISEGGGNSATLVSELIRDGAIYHGLLSLEDLAKLYWTCSVGLIPYEINAYTEGVNPLKTFEYLAAGLHVVSTAVPAVQAMRGHVSVVPDSDTFVRCVHNIPYNPSESDVQERRLIAELNSWQVRGFEARGKVSNLVVDLGS